MTTHRRDFFTAVGSVLASGAILTGHSLGGGFAKTAGVRVRKNASNLTETSPDIVSLKKAVELMKTAMLPDGSAMAANDGRRWEKQALIHGTPEEFTNCQHQNWYFLPWHRMYLYHFEAIVRHLSGNDDFALPFWDWSRHRTLPATFWGVGNPLDCPERMDVDNSGRQPGRTPPMDATTRIGSDDFNRVFSPTRISDLLNLDNFEDFGGGEVTMPGEANFAGELERGPHNRGHTWVGIRPTQNGQDPDRVGDMALGNSPTDPIFWLHHCNIDRLWARWVRRHPSGHPASVAWRNTSFDHFFGLDGNLVPAADRIDVAKTLDTINLGYKYNITDTPIVTTGGTQNRILSSLTVTDAKAERGLQSFKLAATDNFIAGVNKIIDEPATTADRQSIRLVISGLKTPKRQDTYYDVFLNCKHLTAETPITDPSYVGSCTFFHGMGRAGGAHGGGVAFAMNLNQKFLQLYADKPFGKDDPLDVAIIARVPGIGDEPAKTVELLRINPERVKIEIVGR